MPSTVGVVTTTTTSAAAGDSPSGPVRTITVTAVGQAKGQPDALTLSLGVFATAGTATDALATVSTKTRSLLDAVGQAGIADDDVQTAGLGVNPAYDYTSQTPDRPPRATGYMATNQVTVIVRGLDKVGSLIDAAASAVGDGFQMYGGGLSFQDATSQRAAARADALNKARLQAEQLATGIGGRLGTILAVTEGTSPPGAHPALYAASAASAMPIQPGTQTVDIVVTVTFELD